MTRITTVLFSLLALGLLLSPAHADTAAFDKQMQPILEQYLIIPKTLAADKTEGVKEAAKKIAALADKLDPASVTGEHRSHYKDIPKNLKAGAAAVIASTDIGEMRQAVMQLSKPMAMWATMSKPKGVSVMYCSMSRGSWLQKDDTQIANPYYGAQMLRCGEIVSGFGKSEGDKKEKGGGHDMHGDGMKSKGQKSKGHDMH